MIECYLTTCPYHLIHTGPDEGPFCDQVKCQLTDMEIKMFLDERRKQIEDSDNK